MAGMPTSMMMGKIEVNFSDGTQSEILVDAVLPLPNGLLIKHRDGQMEFMSDRVVNGWVFVSQALLSEMKVVKLDS